MPLAYRAEEILDPEEIKDLSELWYLKNEPTFFSMHPLIVSILWHRVKTKERAMVKGERIKELVLGSLSSRLLARRQKENFKLTCSPGQLIRIILGRAFRTKP